jgi:hypothetical protein
MTTTAAPRVRQKPGPKPNPEARRRPRGVKWSDAEWAHVQRCAKDADLTRSEWIRRACGL